MTSRAASASPSARDAESAQPREDPTAARSFPAAMSMAGGTPAPRIAPARPTRSSTASGIRGGGARPAPAASAASASGWMPARMATCLVQAAPGDLFPPGVETLQVEDRLRDQEAAPRPATFLASRNNLQLQRIGVRRRHGAQAERAGPRQSAFAHQRAVARPGRRRSAAIGPHRRRRRSWRRGSGPASGACRWCTARCGCPGPARPAPRRPARCGCGRAWSRAGSARRPRPATSDAAASADIATRSRLSLTPTA